MILGNDSLKGARPSPAGRLCRVCRPRLRFVPTWFPKPANRIPYGLKVSHRHDPPDFPKLVPPHVFAVPPPVCAYMVPEDGAPGSLRSQGFPTRTRTDFSKTFFPCRARKKGAGPETRRPSSNGAPEGANRITQPFRPFRSREFPRERPGPLPSEGLQPDGVRAWGRVPTPQSTRRGPCAGTCS